MDIAQDQFGLPQQSVDPKLPPAGYKREEELKVRMDNLQQQIDERSEQTLAADPAALRPEREILNELDKGHLSISDADPNYHYAWVQCLHPADHPSRMVERKKAETVQLPDGSWVRPWEVIGSAHKEAQECKKADGTRRIGDVLLMRCRKDHYALLELSQRRKVHERNYGIDSDLVELALANDTEAGALTYNKYRDNANYHLRDKTFQTELDRRIRSGTLPGFEMNRR
jgi:hypothetical protein